MWLAVASTDAEPAAKALEAAWASEASEEELAAASHIINHHEDGEITCPACLHEFEAGPTACPDCGLNLG